MSTETVEWGNERRLPAPLRRLRFTLPPMGGTLAVGVLAGLGFLLTIGGETLPWLTISIAGQPQIDLSDTLGLTDGEMRLSQLVVWQAPAYYAGLTALLAFIAIALFGRATGRRGAAAAALGCAAGQAVLLAGVYSTMSSGSDVTGTLSRVREMPSITIDTGNGFYSATIGVLVLAAAAGLALRAQIRSAHSAPGNSVPGYGAPGYGATGAERPADAGHEPETRADTDGGPGIRADADGEPGAPNGSRSGGWERPAQDAPLDLTVAPASPFERPPTAPFERPSPGA
jgi:hypothetical protein